MSAQRDRGREARAAAFDSSDYPAVYAQAGEKVLRDLGFAVRASASPLNAAQRAGRVTARADGAYRSLVEVQQSLFDDDEEVRRAAREGAYRVLRRAYTGDQHEHAWTEFTTHNPIDRLVQRLLLVKDPDGPEPWWAQRGPQVAVRRAGIVTAILFAALAAVLVAFGHPAPAIPLLLAAAATDIAEGAFARSVHMREAGLRWLSCIGSHAGDLMIMSAVAVAAARGHHALWGGAVMGATLATLFGSFVRVSAMQAGYRFWRSRSERFARYVGLLAYLVLALCGYAGVGVVALITVCSVSGLSELYRVIRGVLRMPAIQGGGVVFVDSNEVLQAWPLTDDSAGERWGDAPTTARATRR